MSADRFFVLIFGGFGIIFVYWFFFMKKSSQAVEAKGEVRIIVDGGYNPEKISIPLGRIIRIIFLRKDPSSCLEEVVLPEFKIKKYLPLNKEVKIEIMPNKKGEFEIVCGMNMFHGRIIVQ